MPSADELLIRIRLSGARAAAAEADVVSASVKRIGTAAKEADASAAASMGRVGKNMERTGRRMSMIGRGMTDAFTKPIVGVVGASAFMAARFDRDMAMVQTQSGASAAEVKRMTNYILDLGGKVTQSPDELAKAIYRLEGQGLRGAKAMHALKAASDLATLGNANLEDTAKTLGQVWVSGIKGAGNFQHNVAILNATVGQGDIRMQDLVDALGTGLPSVAHLAGLSLADVTAAIAVFGDNTKNVSGWSAQFATSLHFVTSPGKKATAALSELGLGAHTLSNEFNKPRGLLLGLTDLKTRLEKLPGGIHGAQAKDVLGAIFPGGRGRPMQVLLDQLTRLGSKYGMIDKGQKKLRDNMAATAAQPMVKFQKGLNQLESSAIKLGNAVLPTLIDVFNKIVGVVTKVANWFNHLSKGQKKLVIDVLAFLALAGPLFGFFGRWVSRIGWVVRALGGLVRSKFGQKIATEMVTRVASVPGTLYGFAARFGSVGSALGATFSAAFVVMAGKQIQNWVDNLTNTNNFGNALNFMSDKTFLNPLNGLTSKHGSWDAGTRSGNPGAPPVAMTPHGRLPHGTSSGGNITGGSGFHKIMVPRVPVVAAPQPDQVIHNVVQVDGKVLWENWHKHDRAQRNRR